MHLFLRGTLVVAGLCRPWLRVRGAALTVSVVPLRQQDLHGDSPPGLHATDHLHAWQMRSHQQGVVQSQLSWMVTALQGSRQLAACSAWQMLRHQQTAGNRTPGSRPPAAKRMSGLEQGDVMSEGLHNGWPRRHATVPTAAKMQLSA